MVPVSPVVIGLILLLTGASALEAQSLKGSRAAMQRQHRIARQHDYTFLKTAADVRRFVDLGLLVPVRGNADYALASVSHAYARPALRTFIERLAAQYRAACGERLVVTSLTRPLSGQPSNASALSVHPAGMAVDLRASRNRACRRWLDRTLLSLERQGVLDATLERFPVHYHVALFPAPYLRYVDALESRRGTRLAANDPPKAAPATTQLSTVAAATARAAAQELHEEAELDAYVVNRGDTLWSIARRHGTSVDELKQINNLTSTRIAAGQVLTLPSSSQ